MDTENTAGQALHSDDPDARRQAAALMGAARTERKSQSSRENVKAATEARRGKPMSEEHKAKIAATRLAQEAARKQAAPVIANVEKKPPGRPRKDHADVETAGEKRGRGRPRKQEGTEATA